MMGTPPPSIGAWLMVSPAKVGLDLSRVGPVELRGALALSWSNSGLGMRVLVEECVGVVALLLGEGHLVWEAHRRGADDRGHVAGLHRLHTLDVGGGSSINDSDFAFEA
ncbi:MAG: hypothetical protein P4K83_05440 [Terracidiphilus sp.]|nr:hypothetical protein [Terracidiphilus sp.]